MLEVKDGKIYVEGVETIDAELIGFAFLDGLESKSTIIIDKPKNILSEISNAFQIGDFVYLKHDAEQLPRMIIEIRMKKYEFLYVCQSGVELSDHNDFELSKTKTIF